MITDAASTAPIPGARVELLADVTGSFPPIAVAIAGPDGSYRLDEVPAISDIRVTYDGYVAATAHVELAGHATRNVSLAWDSAHAFAGRYTLTIEADDACPSAPQPLPAHLRRRTYLAEIQQAGSRLTVSVASPCERDDYGGFGCRITGRASTNGATFQLTRGEDLGYALMPDLVERLGFSIDLRTGLGDSSGLWFFGEATTHIIPNGLSGHLSGTITLHSWIFPAPNYPIVAGCGGGRFEMLGR